MSDRYVISHTGKKGGPWEAAGDGQAGVSTATEGVRNRASWQTKDNAERWLARIRRVHPHAKVFRLVRRKKAKGCAVHDGQIHGGEAEELRRGLEALIAEAEGPSGCYHEASPSDVRHHVTGEPPRDVAVEHAYGSSFRLSQPVRVF